MNENYGELKVIWVDNLTSRLKSQVEWFVLTQLTAVACAGVGLNPAANSSDYKEVRSIQRNGKVNYKKKLMTRE